MPTLEQGRIVWAEVVDSSGRNRKARPLVILTPSAEVPPGEPFVAVAVTTSSLAIPVSGRALYATGDVKLSLWVALDLRDGTGNFVAYDFQVDTGTEITTFPAHEPKRLGLHVPQRPANIRHEQTGLEVRSGMLAFRVIGMDQTLSAVPCFSLWTMAYYQPKSPQVLCLFLNVFLASTCLDDR